MKLSSICSRHSRLLLGMIITALVFSVLSLSAETSLYEIAFKNAAPGQAPKDWQKFGQPEFVDLFTLTNGVWRADKGTDWVLAIYKGRDSKGQPSDTWSDCIVKATVRQSADGVTGVVARFQNPTSYYHARLSGTADKAKFELYRIGGQGGSKALADPADVHYPPGESWRIELSVIGDQVTARLINAKGVEVTALNGTDPTYRTGTAGVRVLSRGFAAVIEDFSVSAP